MMLSRRHLMAIEATLVVAAHGEETAYRLYREAQEANDEPYLSLEQWRRRTHLVSPSGLGDAMRALEIAEQADIPDRYLEPIMHELSRDGILRGRRGPNGGYRLGRAPRNISLGDIVRTARSLDQTEDPLMTRGGSELATSVLRPLLVELRTEAMRRLDSITLADLLAEADNLQAAE